MEIYRDIEQGSDGWRQARCGIVTASMFKTVLANGKGGGESITRRKYMYALAGERVTGEPAETFSNKHMDRGRSMEAEARRFYEFMHDCECEQIGFIRNGDKGCSPDSLIGTSGALEIKTALPGILVELILKDNFPPEHKAQTQGQLWVAERDWIDLQIFWPGMPPLIKRAYRDEAYIRDLAAAVDQFNAELNEVVERIKSYGLREQEAA
jgi:hypothetical protein